jgi:hypothetical protein
MATNNIPIFNRTVLSLLQDQNSGKSARSTSLNHKNPQYCLFEDHQFNMQTKVWDVIDSSKGLRRCLHSKCTRKHKLVNRPIKICKRENDCPDAGISCFLLHDNTKLTSVCHWGKDCCDLECIEYRHPFDRTSEVCPNGELCADALISCFKLHPMAKLIPLCHYKEECINYICSKRHPPTRKQVCEQGSLCWEFITGGEKACSKLHPKILQKVCRWSIDEGKYCNCYGCPFIHRPNDPIDCDIGLQCQTQFEIGDKKCPYKHPRYSRIIKLNDGSFQVE